MSKSDSNNNDVIELIIDRPILTEKRVKKEVEILIEKPVERFIQQEIPIYREINKKTNKLNYAERLIIQPIENRIEVKKNIIDKKIEQKKIIYNEKVEEVVKNLNVNIDFNNNVNFTNKDNYQKIYLSNNLRNSNKDSNASSKVQKRIQIPEVVIVKKPKIVNKYEEVLIEKEKVLENNVNTNIDNFIEKKVNNEIIIENVYDKIEQESINKSERALNPNINKIEKVIINEIYEEVPTYHDIEIEEVYENPTIVPLEKKTFKFKEVVTENIKKKKVDRIVNIPRVSKIPKSDISIKSNSNNNNLKIIKKEIIQDVKKDIIIDKVMYKPIIEETEDEEEIVDVVKEIKKYNYIFKEVPHYKEIKKDVIVDVIEENPIFTTSNNNTNNNTNINDVEYLKYVNNIKNHIKDNNLKIKTLYQENNMLKNEIAKKSFNSKHSNIGNENIVYLEKEENIKLKEELSQLQNYMNKLIEEKNNLNRKIILE